MTETLHPKIELLKDKIYRLAQKINAPEQTLPVFNRSASREEFFRYVTYEANSYHLVDVERSREKKKESTEDENLIIYWVFENVTLEMAIRIKSEGLDDKHKGLQQIRRELMGKLDLPW